MLLLLRKSSDWYCQLRRIQYIIGCDANAHHTIWGSTDTNSKGEYLAQFIYTNNLEVINIPNRDKNEGNKYTFVTGNRQEVLDLTLASPVISKKISE